MSRSLQSASRQKQQQQQQQQQRVTVTSRVLGHTKQLASVRTLYIGLQATGTDYAQCTVYAFIHHRLNGSSSYVLTATSLSYGKAKNLTPPHNQNPWSDWDKIWHGWWRRRDDPSCKISCKSAQRGFSANRWNICKNFSSYTYAFFQKLTYRSDPSADFCVRGLKRRGLAQRCAFWKLKKLKLIFNVFIQKIPKIRKEPMGKIKQLLKRVWFSGMANLMVSLRA